MPWLSFLSHHLFLYSISPSHFLPLPHLHTGWKRRNQTVCLLDMYCIYYTCHNRSYSTQPSGLLWGWTRRKRKRVFSDSPRCLPCSFQSPVMLPLLNLKQMNWKWAIFGSISPSVDAVCHQYTLCSTASERAAQKVWAPPTLLASALLHSLTVYWPLCVRSPVNLLARFNRSDLT